MGDIPQLGTDNVAATNNDVSSSRREPHPEHELTKVDGAKRFAAGKSQEGLQSAEMVVDTAGVIPRAVDDIFRIVRQGGVRERAATTPLPWTPGRHSFHEPPDEPQPPPAEAPPSPSSARGGGSVSAPNACTPDTGNSTRSSGSSSSEESSLTQTPSAAHWPLSEPIVYVPPFQIPRGGSVSPARQRVRHDESKNRDHVGMEGGGGSDEKLRACQEKRGETITTSKYSVLFSYMQVRLEENQAKERRN